jgi:hypothetical protein
VLVATPSSNPNDDACHAVPNQTGHDYQLLDSIIVDRPVGVFSHEVEIIGAGKLEASAIGRVCEFQFTVRNVPSQLAYHIRVGTDEWLIPRDDIEGYGWNVRLSTNRFDCEQPFRYRLEPCYGPNF